MFRTYIFKRNVQNSEEIRVCWFIHTLLFTATFPNLPTYDYEKHRLKHVYSCKQYWSNKYGPSEYRIRCRNAVYYLGGKRLRKTEWKRQTGKMK